MAFTRITSDPEVCAGKPCIRGLRFPVARLLGLLAAGETAESILKAYPYLEGEDIAEALRYAAFLAEIARETGLVTETRAIIVNGIDYAVTLERFDDDIVVGGQIEQSYHDYYLAIEGPDLRIKARTYDDEDQVSIQSGLKQSDADAIEVVRAIARQLFGTETLLLNTVEGYEPI
jgi:uncharacterized protein (DUF433 family)